MQTIRVSRLVFVAVISIVLTNKSMADLTSVNWVSDTYSSFDVFMSGTGEGWAGTLTSPSGLWQLDSDNAFGYDPDIPLSGYAGSIWVSNSGDAVYLGQLPPQYPTPTPHLPSPGAPNYTGAAIYMSDNYDDIFAPVAPIIDGNGFGGGLDGQSYLCQGLQPGNPYPYLNWTGSSSIELITMPDVNDPSTWTWQAEYFASGDNLQPTPEPSTFALAAIGGISCLMMFRRQQKIPVKVKARLNR